jgi:FtsH-binding integral membrane protein
MSSVTQVAQEFCSAANDTAEARATFFRRTYATLAAALALFLVLETCLLNSQLILSAALSVSSGVLWLLVLGGYMLATSLASHWAKSAPSAGAQYAALLLYVAAEAFLFLPIMYLAIGLTGDISILKSAGMLGGCLFVAATLIAMLFPDGDFSLFRAASVAGGVIGLGLIVCNTLFGFTLGTWFSFAMVGVALSCILYRTRRMFDDYAANQHVAAALGLFGAFMLVLWYVIDLKNRYAKS